MELTGVDSRLEQVQGRAGIYRWLGRLLLSEVDGPALAFLRQNRELLPSGLLPDADRDEVAWLQDLRVEYSHLFLLNVYPYASVYLDDQAMLNTGPAEAVAACYDRFGFRPDTGVFTDHLGQALLFLAHLAGLEAAELNAGHPATADVIREQAARFATEFVLDWLPLLYPAVERAARQPFYPQLVRLALEFTALDFGQLNRQQFVSGASIRPETQAQAGVEADDSLNGLVRRLTVPARCGLFLSKYDLYHLAREMRLPAGAGDRFQILKGLLEAAARYELLPALTARLTGLLEQQQAYLPQLEADLGYPGWRRWQVPLEQTIRLLNQVKAAG